MKIEGKERISHSAERVFTALRDKTHELVSFMPNIDAMEVVERDDAPPLTTMLNKWRGANSDVPRIIRPFVSTDLLSWFDKAIWNEDDLICNWQLESITENKVFTCIGSTTMRNDGEGSTFVIDADLRINADQVPGIPKFLARKVREPLERFIASTLRPNLTKTAHAVQDYLDAQ
jgi:hypothetical protein